MPWTLYRYIAKELLKLMIAAALVLVLVISFAASIKPMKDGLLGPEATVKFVMFTAPAMLTYVLPFAGAFASTLVFLRMTNDNEIVACSASGMSYGQILMPVMVLGLVITMGLFGMSNFVIPRFHKAAAQTIERDLMSLLVKRLNTGQPFELRDTVLYADSAETVPPENVKSTGGPPPDRVVMLRGVVVGQTDDDGLISGDATARQANVALYRDQGQSWVTILLEDAMFYHPERGQLIYQERQEQPAVRMPNYFMNRPKYLSWPELRELRRRPERLENIRKDKIRLAASIAAMNLAERLRAGPDAAGGQARGSLVLEGGQPGSRYTLRAPIIEAQGDTLTLRATQERPVVVELQSGTSSDRRYEAQTADVRIEAGDEPYRPIVDIELLEARVHDLRSGGGFTESKRTTLPRLVPTEPMLDRPVDDYSVDQLFHLAQQPPYNTSQQVSDTEVLLARSILNTNRRIKGQLHARAASSIAFLLLLLMGTLISMLCRGSLPLVVFFWSFLLAIVSIVIMSSGQNMAKDIEIPLALSLSILWSGNLMLAVVLGVVYCRLARH